jgi:hypothetical protein
MLLGHTCSGLGYQSLTLDTRLRASLPHCTELLYVKIQYCLMITIPTHKCHKNPFKLSKTIYIFTYGRVIVTVQIHSRKMILKEL